MLLRRGETRGTPDALAEGMFSLLRARIDEHATAAAGDLRVARQRVGAFLAALADVAPKAGAGTHAFVDAAGGCRGWVQFIQSDDATVVIHRLWTLQPCNGNGTAMLCAICDLADRHDVEIALKVLPFGRKPYPLTRDQLLAWYQRHGFEGTRRKMTRKPRTPAFT